MAAIPGYGSASLYVGDLLPDVNETQLFEVFKQIGPVASIRVCRDAVTRRSLGYAYVNFHNMADADRALDLLNYKEIKGKPCRIMWSQRDPNLRKVGTGNIFIKNLDKSIDNKALYDTFATFGNILSCKVQLDEHGNSRGFGFVHYETEDSARNAIEGVNGMLLSGKKVFVGEFMSRRDREKESNAQAKWTNIFVKNLHKSVSEEELRKIFSKFGNITSCVLSVDEEGKSKGFGFVNYENHQEAARAVEEINGTEIEGQEVFVGRAQKKGEREKELKDMFEKLKRERMSKYQGVNLYVKNLDDSIDDERLRQEFSQCGIITSAKIMRDEKNGSKGFGFVCFSTPDEATKAVTEMNGKIIMNKPIYVALAQRKEQRRAQLEAQRNQALRGIPPQALNPMYPPGAAPVFFPPGRSPGFLYPQPIVPRGGRFQPPPPSGGRGYQPVMLPPAVPRGAVPTPARPQRGPEAPAPGYSMGIKFNPNVRNPQQSVSSPQEPHLSEKKPIDKNMIGETLYGLLENALKAYNQTDLAGKITGMLLESMEEQELLEILQSSDALDKKIAEALDVLEQHNMAERKKSKAYSENQENMDRSSS